MAGVTAYAVRAEREAFDLPETVSLLHPEAIAKEQPSDLGDLLVELPNIDIAGGPRSIGQRTVIRGISDARVLYLLDGARQNFERGHNSRLFLEPELVKTIEVVRGPASALWGSGAIGGVVGLTTKDAADLLVPRQKFGTLLKGGFQSASDQGLGSASVYGLFGEEFDYLLHFTFRGAGDLHLGRGRLDHSGFNSFSGLARFTWSPGDHRLGFSALTFDQNQEVPSNPQSLGGQTNPLVERLSQQRNFLVKYGFSSEKSWLKPVLLVYHNSILIEENRVPIPRRDVTDFTTTGLSASNRTRLGLWEAVTQELTYGLDFYHDEGRATRDGKVRSEFPEAESDVIGLYVQDELTLWRRLSLTFGVRWDDFANRAQNSRQQTNEVTFRTGALWWLTKWLGLNLAYNEAFRAPSLQELFVSGTHFTCGPGCANLLVPNPNLNPEKAHNKEVGLRLKFDRLWFAEDKLRARASFFRNQVDDFIDSVVVFSPRPTPPFNLGPGGFTTNRNVRNAELEGFEVELSYEAPYGYVSASYAQTRGRDKTQNQPLANVAPDEWVVQAGLRHPEWGVSFDWRTRLVEDQDRVPQGVADTPGFTVHDLRLAWQPRIAALSGLRLEFAVDNLGNRDYREHLSLLKSAGRSFKTSLSLRF